MKKFIGLLFIPVLALFSFFGCSKDKSAENIKTQYTSTIRKYYDDDIEKNIFFADDTNENTVKIYYPSSIQARIDITNPTNNMQKMYRGLYYQQVVLDKIYKYYEMTQEDFYTKMSSKGSDKSIGELSTQLERLDRVLDEFKVSYNNFLDNQEMEFNVTSYSFALNKVIDVSFDFIYNYIRLYEKNCRSTTGVYTSDTLQIDLYKSYVDVAFIVYKENIKAFTYSVGENGICDLSPVVKSSSTFNILDKLLGSCTLSLDIANGLNNADNAETLDKVNNYYYFKSVFEQRLVNYKQIYAEQDIYTITRYRFNLVNGVDYDNYLNSLSISQRSNVTMLDDFVANNFNDYYNKISAIVA